MQKNLTVLFLLALFVMPGCAPSLIKKAPPDTSISSVGKDVLIFGRISWFENGEEKKRSITLKVMRAEDMKKGTIKVEKDGSFFALLPKGTYVVHQLDWWDPWDGPHWLVPKAAFRAADDQRAYYLGTLVVDIKAKRDMIGGLWVKGVGVGIEDEENEAMEAFRKRYSDQEIKVANALMVHDRSIPRIEELENKRVLLDVLRSLYFGVMPMLSP